MASKNKAFPPKNMRMLLALISVAVCLVGLHAQSTPGSNILLPRFDAATSFDSGLALFNPSAGDAFVTLSLTDANGNPVRTPVTVTVPALGQLVRTGSQLFGSFTSLEASLKITSPTPGITACYQTFDARGSYMDGTDAPSADLSLIFPVIPGSAPHTTEIVLHNANNWTASAELALWNTSGAVLARAVVSIPGKGRFRGTAETLFPAFGSFISHSHVTVTSRPLNLFTPPYAVSGTSLFSGLVPPVPGASTDTAALNALTPAQTFNTGAIPHYRAGQVHFSTVAIANAEPAPVDATLTAIRNNGTTAATRKVTIPGNGGFRQSLGSVFPSLAVGEQEGWILLQATGRVAASLIHGRSDTGAMTAIPLQKLPQFDFVFAQAVQGSGFLTDVSLANAGPNTANAEIFVISPGGYTLASNQVTLGPGARVSNPLNVYVPELQAPFAGAVTVRSSEPLFAAASVWSDSAKVLSNFAPLPLPGQYRPAPLKIFAVTGTVTFNNRPVEDFTVVLSGPVSRIVQTAADGSYIIAGLPPGSYSMAVDQFGFNFIPSPVSFELRTASRRQNFQGFTPQNGLLVHPSSFPAGSREETASIYGTGFNATSTAWVGPVQLKTTFVEHTRLKVVLPPFLLETATRFKITVVTDDQTPQRRVSDPYEVVVYLDIPTLAGITTDGEILEGSPQATIHLAGSGFLPGASVKVNGRSEGIQINLRDEGQIIAVLPGSYLWPGGIYPVTVQNPYPSNAESNIQLLTVFHPRPAIQSIWPERVSARLEDSAGPLKLEVFGYGFRRGAVVLFEDKPLATAYCEETPSCLWERLSAQVPPSLLKSAGFYNISVKNPDPSLGPSQIAFLRVENPSPTITSVNAGGATILNLPPPNNRYSLVVVVNGTNFGPDAEFRAYKVGDIPPEFKKAGAVVSSTQLYFNLEIEYPLSIGEWLVQVKNPQPGGGVSGTASFFVTEGTFDPNPFIVSLSPGFVNSGGPAFTLSVTGSNFVDGSQVNLFSAPLATTFVNAGLLQAVVPGYMIAIPGKRPVTVTNPGNGGTSNFVFIEVR